MEKREIYKLKEDFVDHGSGLIHQLFSPSHRGVQIGSRVLLSILPETKKRKELIKFFQVYHEFIFYRQHPKYSDKERIKNIHFNVDRMGKVAYFSVPSEWMQRI